MVQPDRRRQLGILLAVLLGVGLAAFAVVNVLRWYHAGGAKEESVIRPIALGDAPMAVQEAAAKLATSRVGYAIPMGNVTYLVISTGEMGERIELAGAKVSATSPAWVDIHVRSVGSGDRLVVAALNKAVTDTRTIQYDMDGQAAGIPALVNADDLPLTALPDKNSLVLVSPQAQARVVGSGVQVTGYARIFEGQFSIQILSAGKGRVLGEVKGVHAATGAPNWGSFKVNVPVNIPPGMTEGILLAYDPESGAKVAVPIRFGSK